MNKNDFVMLISGNGTDAWYPNMYRVQRLKRDEKNYGNDVRAIDADANPAWAKQVANSDKIRSTITLDMSTNSNFCKIKVGSHVITKNLRFTSEKSSHSFLHFGPPAPAKLIDEFTHEKFHEN